jgi:hypothetical protein
MAGQKLFVHASDRGIAGSVQCCTRAPEPRTERDRWPIGEAGTPSASREWIDAECQLAIKHLMKVCGKPPPEMEPEVQVGTRIGRISHDRLNVGTSATSFSAGSDVTHSDARSDAA